MIPFLDRIDGANRILIVGCGGGFDVYSGVPLAMRLLARGKYVALANYSFTSFDPLSGERVTEVLWRVDTRDSSLTYFPERWLCEWLAGRDIAVPVYAFIQPGVLPLAEALRAIVATHAIDLVVLVDGGTDSLIFGDEPGLGTVTEDAITLVAADIAAPGRVLLAALGFGIDEFHGVSHHSFLENVATLGREGGYLGAFSLTPGSTEADALLELIDLANARQTTLPSIVNNSVASALRGEFGNFHRDRPNRRRHPLHQSADGTLLDVRRGAGCGSHDLWQRSPHHDDASSGKASHRGDPLRSQAPSPPADPPVGRL